MQGSNKNLPVEPGWIQLDGEGATREADLLLRWELRKRSSQTTSALSLGLAPPQVPASSSSFRRNLSSSLQQAHALPSADARSNREHDERRTGQDPKVAIGLVRMCNP
jgi:hypothetical protein